MNRLIALFKKLRLRQILTVFLAGALLVISTACNPGNQSANPINPPISNPNNPPVQAGGMNNPYKSGGDANTDLNKAKGDRASANLSNSKLIAATENEILYPGAETPAGRAEKETELPIKTSKDFAEPRAGGLNQRNPELGERVENRVEAAKDAFKEAASFVKDKSDEAGRRPELQSNPALHK